VAPESELVAPPEPPSLISALTPPPAPTSEAVPPAPAEGARAAVAPAEESAELLIHEPASAAVAPPPNDFEPSAELIASATEGSPSGTLGSYSTEPVPFADLADALAHETTYAEAHAAVVHIDEPYTKSGEPEAPPVVERAVEQPAAPTEHHAGPAVEILAAAAAAAVATTVVAESASHPAPPSEPAEPAVEEPAAAIEPVVVEPPAAVHPPETVAAAAQSVDEPPAAPSEPPAPAAPEPSPHLLFPVPRHPVEHAHLEVLPPPSLPLRRFDQDAVQALFMTEETLDLPKISRLAAGLPGVYACVIATRDQACTGGTLPDGFDLAALLGLAPRVGEAAGRMPIGQLKHFTLYGEAYSVSFFERHGLSLCAVHRPRSFVPGVREKLVALADELSR